MKKITKREAQKTRRISKEAKEKDEARSPEQKEADKLTAAVNKQLALAQKGIASLTSELAAAMIGKGDEKRWRR